LGIYFSSYLCQSVFIKVLQREVHGGAVCLDTMGTIWLAELGEKFMEIPQSDKWLQQAF